jgi:hypothetical protein
MARAEGEAPPMTTSSVVKPVAITCARALGLCASSTNAVATDRDSHLACVQCFVDERAEDYICVTVYIFIYHLCSGIYLQCTTVCQVRDRGV